MPNLLLRTRQGNDIPNETSFMDLGDISREDKDFRKSLPNGSSPVNFGTQVYNCHGLVFAARRSWVFDKGTINIILGDDEYATINEKDAWIGDIVLYWSGEICEHSGLVIENAKNTVLGIPRILSKFGHLSEVVHYAHICGIYSGSPRTYHRVTTVQQRDAALSNPQG